MARESVCANSMDGLCELRAFRVLCQASTSTERMVSHCVWRRRLKRDVVFVLEVDVRDTLKFWRPIRTVDGGRGGTPRLCVCGDNRQCTSERRAWLVRRLRRRITRAALLRIDHSKLLHGGLSREELASMCAALRHTASERTMQHVYMCDTPALQETISDSERMSAADVAQGLATLLKCDSRKKMWTDSYCKPLRFEPRAAFVRYFTGV